MNSLKEKLRDAIRANPKRAVISGLITMLVLVALYLNFDFCGAVWPSERTIGRELTKLKDMQEKLRKTMDKSRELEGKIQHFAAAGNGYWLKLRDGNPEVDLRRRIEKAARAAGLQLKAVGNLRTVKIIDNVACYEISISADGEIKPVTEFLAALYQGTPRLFWDNLNLRPDNIQNPKMVVLNGTVKTIAVDAPDLVKLLSGGKS